MYEKHDKVVIIVILYKGPSVGSFLKNDDMYSQKGVSIELTLVGKENFGLTQLILEGSFY